MKETIGFISLGCPKNRVDSEVMLGELKRAGYSFTSQKNKAQIIIINTCCFIHSAEQESRETIAEFSDWREGGKIKKLIVTGCLPQKYKLEIKKMFPAVDVFLGPGNFHELVKIIEQDGKNIIRAKTPKYLYHHLTPRVSTTPFYYRYVKIAEGCNNFCRYCLIPYLRGPYRSRRISSVVREVETLAEQGAREIILIAQDTTNYGLDLYQKRQIVKLLKALSQIPSVEWIRLMYTHPFHLTEDLLECLAKERKICSYLDLPIQHISSAILKKMGRQGDRKFLVGLFKRIRKRYPQLALRTSLLVGFPGETERHFEELVSFIQEIKFNRLGVFIYSPQPGTPAAKLKNQIPLEIKEERRNILMRLQQKISYQHHQNLVGKEIRVLLEQQVSLRPPVFSARSEYDAPEIDGLVYIGVPPKKAKSLSPGQFEKVRITKATEYDLNAEII